MIRDVVADVLGHAPRASGLAMAKTTAPEAIVRTAAAETAPGADSPM